MVALFAFEGVQVDAGGRAVLAVDHLTIPDGGLTVLVGPSGSGKSTLLRLCNRLTAPTSGTVRFRGEDVAGLDPLAHRRRVGMVFQRPAPFPGTGRDNLLVACPLAEDDVLGDQLGRAGLDRGFLDRRADELSGGEAQRLCLARTLATGPEVLLLDEPTSALDLVATRQFEDLARGIAAGGVPVLWVTHDLPQARRVADGIVVLVDGRLADDHERAHVLEGQPADHHHGDSGGGGHG